METFDEISIVNIVILNFIEKRYQWTYSGWNLSEESLLE